MTRNRHNPDRDPTPAELAAWADGELDAADAARVERWLLDHPEAESEVESNSRLVGLFRDHPPAEPSPDAWDATLNRIADRAARDRRLWQPMLWLTLGAAAAVIAAVCVAGLMWP